jgi:Zn-finger nucleic acid-binding protein
MTAHRTALVCPRCATHSSSPPPLYAGSASQIVLHACGACGGVFLGTKCAAQLASSLPTDALQLASQVSDAARYRADTAIALSCPVCHDSMQRSAIARAGVEIDLCAKHGTWYDRDELARVAGAIRSSGWGPAVGTGATSAALAGGALAGAAVLGAAGQPSPAMDQVNQTLGDVAGATAEVALEVGADTVLEGVFGLLGLLFE